MRLDNFCPEHYDQLARNTAFQFKNAGPACLSSCSVLTKMRETLFLPSLFHQQKTGKDIYYKCQILCQWHCVHILSYIIIIITEGNSFNSPCVVNGLREVKVSKIRNSVKDRISFMSTTRLPSELVTAWTLGTCNCGFCINQSNYLVHYF